MLIARNYPFGTALRMGPGLFPDRARRAADRCSASTSWPSGLRSSEKIDGAWSLRALIVLPLSLVLFGLLMEYAGFVPAMLVLIFGSAAASSEFRFVEVLLFSIGLTALCGRACSSGRSACPTRCSSASTDAVMELFDNLIFGFGVALSLQNLLYCLIGVTVGTLIGVLPGIGPLATIAMLLPITYDVSPVGALIMLAGIYYGAQYGGSTTAILVNLPGETSAVVTCIDGYQMARQGRAGPALAIAAHRLVLRRHRRHAADRAVRPAARRGRAQVRLAGIFLADADGAGRRGGAGAGRHDQVAGHGGDGPAARHRRHRRQYRRAALQLRHHRTVRRHRLHRGGGRRVRDRRDHRQPRRPGGAARLHRQGDEPVADEGRSEALDRPDPARHRARLVLRRAARHRAGDRLVRLLHGGEEARQGPLALRQGRDRGRGRARSRQQRRRAVQVHPDADARPAGQRRDGADARRAHHPGHPARPRGDDAAARICSGA